MEVPGLRSMAVEDLPRGVRDENTNPSTGVNKDYIDGFGSIVTSENSQMHDIVPKPKILNPQPS